MLHSKRLRYSCGSVLVLALLAAACPLTVYALGVPFGFGGQAVGGIKIDANGVLSEMKRGDFEAARRVLMGKIGETPETLQGTSELRKVSLRKLLESIENSGEVDLQRLPHHVRYLAGLQRVKYVFVYPEENDIVLVGPGEGWTVNEDGSVVGQKNQQPVMHLEDLIVALRFAHDPEQSVISCSIDPTNEGMRKFQELNAGFLANPPKSHRRAMKQIEQAMGYQTVTVSGIPADSRIARVLVAADYRMKRLAMGFDRPPIKRLPSFLNLLKSPEIQNMMPRWWLEDNYEAIHADEAGLAFELRGQGVKAMTEEEVMNDDGSRVGTGEVDPVAKKWADNMTARYEALARKSPVFAELRNCMDLTVVAALIASEDLPDRAGLDIGLLLDADALTLPVYQTPRHVPTITSQKKLGNFRAITASGGVSFDPWKIAKTRQVEASVAQQRGSATSPADAPWYWN